MISARIDYKDEVDRFTYLMMGVLLKSDLVVPLTLTSTSGVPERFSMARITGEMGMIEFDSREKYPVLIRYKDVVAITKGEIGVTPGSGPVNISSKPGTEVVDTVIRFNDRVAVDGVMFPKTIIFESTIWGETEVRFEKIQINPKLTLKDFEIPQ
jgi:hypothetical protein